MGTCESCCSTRQPPPSLFLFHYGATTPSFLAHLLRCSQQSIIDRSIACHIQDYQNAFGGTSKQWGKSSIATIIKSDKQIVKGYCIKHTQKEIDIINSHEGIKRIKVVAWREGMEPKKEEVKDDLANVQTYFENFYNEQVDQPFLNAEAYVVEDVNTFHYPDVRYLNDCAKTQLFHMSLDNNDIQNLKELSIDVRRADTSKVLGSYKYTLQPYDLN